MKFDYKKFKASLACEKSILLQKYEAIYGSVENLADTSFFRHYLSMFIFEAEDVELLNLSAKSKEKNDWKSFIKLASGSFFTIYEINATQNGKIDYEITFDSLMNGSKDIEQIPILTFLGNTDFGLDETSSKVKVTKKISELSEFQINALFEFLIFERIKSSIDSIDERVREAHKLIGMSKVERYDSLMDLVLASLPPAKMKHKVRTKNTFDFDF